MNNSSSDKSRKAHQDKKGKRKKIDPLVIYRPARMEVSGVFLNLNFN